MNEQLVSKIKEIETIITENHDILGEDIHVLRYDAKVHDIAEIIETQKNLLDQGRKLQIGIIGRVKAGKSSLLNALFFNGQAVLPKAATPMTASLTTLSYGDSYEMEVEQFSQEEINTFKELCNQHQENIKQKADALRNSYRVNANNNLGEQNRSPAYAPDYSKLAKMELDKSSPSEAAACELWESIKKAGGIASAKQTQKFSCNTANDLLGKLNDFVGANGSQTHFTKCLHLKLPFDTLKDLIIVDTPGLNDPIRSREHRTEKMLKECDAVFIVSPAGQFLNAQDEQLMARLSNREGVRTFHLIASQFDTQLFGQEMADLEGSLPKVIEKQQNSLINQSKSVISSWVKNNPDISDLEEDFERNLRISSSSAYSLLIKKPELWDETEKHTHNSLRINYPDFFADDDCRRQWLGALSGIPQVEVDIHSIKGNKSKIFEGRIIDYVNGQKNACNEWLSQILTRAEERKALFESSDINSIEQKIKNISETNQTGIEAANDEFSTQVEGVSIDTINKINKIVREKFQEACEESDNAKGTDTERREKSGVGSWLARKLWDGGYENCTVQTIDAKKARRAIKDFRNILVMDLSLYIAEQNLKWRNEFAKNILIRLRESIGDKEVNSDDIRRIVKATLIKLADIPSPIVPEMPEELSTSSVLKGYQAEKFDKDANDYLEALRDSVKPYIKTLNGMFKETQNIKVGEVVFEKLMREAENLKQQMQNKRLTAERYERLINSIKRMSND